MAIPVNQSKVAVKSSNELYNPMTLYWARRPVRYDLRTLFGQNPMIDRDLLNGLPHSGHVSLDFSDSYWKRR